MLIKQKMDSSVDSISVCVKDSLDSSKSIMTTLSFRFE